MTDEQIASAGPALAQAFKNGPDAFPELNPATKADRVLGNGLYVNSVFLLFTWVKWLLRAHCVEVMSLANRRCRAATSAAHLPEATLSASSSI